MKTALLVTVAASAIAASGAALGADLGGVPYAPAPAPVFSWTGCYIGTNGGLGTSHQRWQDTVPDGNIDAFTTSNRTAKTDGSGGVYGGQVGCDMQWGANWVIGVQGTFSGADIETTAQDQFNAPWTLQDRIDWFATVTGRVGWTANTWAPNNLLLYAKGGAAWVHDKLEIENSGVFLGNPTFTRLGWTVGAGIEWVFTPGFSVFVESNYYNFDTNKTASLIPTCCFDAPPFTFNTKETFETLTVGLNWRWGGWTNRW